MCLAGSFALQTLSNYPPRSREHGVTHQVLRLPLHTADNQENILFSGLLCCCGRLQDPRLCVHGHQVSSKNPFGATSSPGAGTSTPGLPITRPPSMPTLQANKGAGIADSPLSLPAAAHTLPMCQLILSGDGLLTRVATQPAAAFMHDACMSAAVQGQTWQ